MKQHKQIKRRKPTIIQKKIEKAENELTKQSRKQMSILLPACMLALNRLHGYSSKRGQKALDMIQNIVDECAAYGPTKSIIQMLSEETGVDMQIDPNGKTWKDIMFLNGDLECAFSIVSDEQYLFMIMQQKKWVPAQLTAACLLAAHRTFGFGEARMYDLMIEIDNIRAEFNEDPKTINAECIKHKVGVGIDFDGGGSLARCSV